MRAGSERQETARLIGRDKATVSRELRRGLWFASNENESYRPYRPKRLKTGPWTSMPFYSALAAQRRADLRRRESRKPRRMDSDRLRSWVMDALRRGWSPGPIEGRLKPEHPGDPVMRVSHERLHQWVYAKPQRDLVSFVKSRWTCSAVDLDTVGVQVGRYGRLVGFLCLLVIS